ncbi:MAG: ParA family protein [Oscillospiraceae bacterium]|nr:ParA family protein [Oscillospiraceae bacterium]
MHRVITLSNQKGGVGKTTTAGAMAAGLVKRGYKVLAIDLDAQGNLSDSFGADNETRPTVYEVMKGDVPAIEAVQSIGGCDIIPSNLTLSSADLEFTQTGREYILKKSIQSVLSNYDYIIIDTPPSLGIMTVNAFAVSDEIIIPTDAGVFAANGIMQLWNTYDTVKNFCNQALTVRGILITRFNPRSIINQDIKTLTENIGKDIDVPVFDTFIRISVAVAEAQANKLDIFNYNEKNPVSQDYNSFIDEYLGKERKHG